MDRLRALQVFREVVRARSFVAAARRLGVSKATVTKQVAALEAALGVQLLRRTTTRVSVTEAGEHLNEAGSDLLERADHVWADVKQVVALPMGTLRVGSPPAFGALLAHALAEFLAQHPEVEITHVLDDGNLDLLAEGLDVSFRIAPALRDSTHVAHLLTRVPQVLVASPAYLRARGRPAAPEDLAGHACLIHALKAPTGIWRMRGAERTRSVRVSGPYRSNFGEVLRQASLDDRGISMHPIYMVSDDLREGRLVEVLRGWGAPLLSIYAVVPQRRHVPARLVAFLGAMRAWFGDERWWERGRG